MFRGTLISLSGVDGSGKTTQIDLLEKRMRKTRSRATVVWSRWRPIFSLPLLAVMKRLGYARVHSTSSIGFVETEIWRSAGLASLWVFLTQLDNFAKTGLKVIIPLLFGKIVVCDRYVLDLITESMADLHDNPKRLRLGHRLLFLLPRPDRSFLISVDPIVAFTRKPDMPTLAHFSERVWLYRELAEKLHVHIVDGSKGVEAIHNKIWERVSPLLRP